MKHSILAASLWFGIMAVAVAAAATTQSLERAESSLIAYQPGKGLTLKTRDNNTALWVGLRFQLRYTDLPGDPVDPSTLMSQPEDELSLNRGRIKGGGHLLRPWLDIYSEYDFPSDALLDYRATITHYPAAMLRIGQWKTEYNRERIDSSGKQQFADRSVANYWFTLDRQLGAELQGRLGEGQFYDTSYWAAIVSGEGRGGGWQDDDPLWVLRCQWNILGRAVPFSQSDIARRTEPVAAISLGGLYGESDYTRYSSDGGGQLPGYEDGESAPYRLRQVMQGSILHAHGFSWQQEWHGKLIDDRQSGDTRRLWGGYAQVGYFVSGAWDALPEPLELAMRYGWVDPGTSHADQQQEITAGANWFFSGHRNKLTADTSLLSLDDPTGRVSEWRVRLQWDVSI